MVGTYHQFGAFVSGVASLPRVVIMTMHNIVLTPRNPTPGAKIGPNSILQLAGTVKTYRYLDDNETPGAGAPAKGGKKAPPPKGGKK
jgi:type IV pilus assembly protein PilO